MIKTLAWPFWLENQAIKQQPPKFSLEKIESILNILQNPQDKMPLTFHVAGTNGKGSTIAFLEAILLDSGYKVCTYTSPNLICINERIKINGEMIDDKTLIDTLDSIRTKIAKSSKPELENDISFFEGITAAAFFIFSQIKFDILLLEVGLGGRLDATNVLTKTQKIDIITSISLDHTELLGDTIEKIVTEKSGIIKPNSLACVLSGGQKSTICQIVRQKCDQTNTKFFEAQTGKLDENGIFEYNGTKYSKPSLYGSHQCQNLSTALKALQCSSLKISENNIKNGIKNAKWQARLQPIHFDFLSKNTKVLLDGAHNEDGIRTLCKYIKEDGGEFHLICGFLKRKNIQKIAEILKEHEIYFKSISITEINSTQESFKTEEIAEIFANYNLNTNQFPNFKEAIKKLNGKKVLIFGSLYLAGEVLLELSR